MRYLLGLFLGVLALTELTAVPARAGSDFAFASTPAITSASADPPGTTNTITNGLSIGGLPAATFSSLAATGRSTITLLGRMTTGPFDASSPVDTPFLDVLIDSDDTKTREFSLSLKVTYTLTDPTAGSGPGPQTIDFLATLTGLIDGRSPTSTNMSFTVADFNPALSSGPTVTVGDGVFHVTLRSFQNAGLGDGLMGSLTARVESVAVPEPASGLLLALGGGFVASGMFRRRLGRSA